MGLCSSEPRKTWNADAASLLWACTSHLSRHKWQRCCCGLAACLETIMQEIASSMLHMRMSSDGFKNYQNAQCWTIIHEQDLAQGEHSTSAGPAVWPFSRKEWKDCCSSVS